MKQNHFVFIVIACFIGLYAVGVFSVAFSGFVRMLGIKPVWPVVAVLDLIVFTFIILKARRAIKAKVAKRNNSVNADGGQTQIEALLNKGRANNIITEKHLMLFEDLFRFMIGAANPRQTALKTTIVTTTSSNAEKTTPADIKTKVKDANCDMFEKSSCAENGRDFNEDAINGVIWRWRKGRRKPEIIGAFCSKCETGLTPVEVAESWQADLKCLNCGKSFVSMPHGENDDKPRSFRQIQKQAAQIINDRHMEHMPDF